MPDQIASYRIVECLGEGGMGTIYLGEQVEPVRRRAALKVVKQGLDTRAVLARFETERQMLARMAHRHIAQIYDAGVDQSGRTYFVMEYVEGTAIHEYCDRERLSVRERVALMATVCHAVQHAHQRGVLHRDLKPSNILVTEDDRTPVPKIIDFGIAKAMGERSAARSVQTEVGQLLGTPDYMSPEQASATDEAETRSDVYSLGVVLYQLLVGDVPLDVRGRNPHEIRQILAQEAPLRPSVRVTRSRDQAAASLRRARVTDLARSLRGDLDWICIRALEKNPDHRYHAPRDLADDLQRFLRHEPVVAGPPSTWYRARRMMRRYRLQATAAAIVALALVVGSAVSAYYSFEEQERADETVSFARQLSAEKETLYRTNEDLATAERATRERSQRADGYYQAARENLDLARERLGDFHATANLQRLAYLEAEEPRLWPARPQLLDRLINWRDRARELVDAEAEVDAVLRRLTARAADSDVPMLETSASTSDAEDGAREWLRGQLTAFRAELPELRDRLIPSVEVRIARATTIVQQTVEDFADEWNRAARSIAATEAYGGMQIAPQVGLVPIGPDPDSELWEFWCWETGERPQRDEATGRLSVTGESGIVLVLIPGGTFLMGSQSDDPAGLNYDENHRSDEVLHEVALDPYFLSKYELTQGQWERIMGPGSNPSYFGKTYLGDAWPLHPVEQVSWNDCREALERMDLVLPTEAQWERAARAGTDTPWSTGRTEGALIEVANLMDLSLARLGDVPMIPHDWEDGFAYHAPVGSFAPNPFGLHDIHGNVWESCQDWHLGYAVGHRSGDGELIASSQPGVHDKVGRGGAFNLQALHARSALRAANRPEARGFSCSCRPAKAIATR